MKRIPYLRVKFADQLSASELNQFRGAFAGKVGLEHHLFHNHQPDGSSIRQYPKIQYKRFGRQAGILAIGDGVAAMDHFFDLKNRSLTMNNRKLDMTIERIQHRQVPAIITEEGMPFRYQTYNWIALNQGNYQKYEILEGLIPQLEMLQSLLNNHLVAVAYGMGLEPETRVQAQLLSCQPARPVRLKNVVLRSFDIEFQSNLLLPDFIGIGKAVARGFGTTKTIKEGQRPRKRRKEARDAA